MTREEAMRTGLPLAINGGGYSEDDNRPEHVEDPHGPSIKVATPSVPTPSLEEPDDEVGWTPEAMATTTPLPAADMAAAGGQDDVDVVLATIERIEQKLRKRLDPRIMQRLEALEKLVS